MEAKFDNNIHVLILFCRGRSASTSCATDLNRLRLCFDCPYKNSQRSYKRPRKIAYLEICRLDSEFFFQRFKFTASAEYGLKCTVRFFADLILRAEAYEIYTPLDVLFLANYCKGNIPYKFVYF